MKNILLCSVILFAITSCTEKKIKQYPYKVTIKSTNLNLTGSALEPEAKEDTVLAENDTLAYHKGLRKYLAVKLTKDMLKGKMGDALSYEITDSLGNNLDAELSVAVRDSLKKSYYKLNKKYEGAFN